MLFEELLKEERKVGTEEGMAEVIIVFLSKYGEVPNTLSEKINVDKTVC